MTAPAMAADPHPELGSWDRGGWRPVGPPATIAVELDSQGAPVVLDDADPDQLLELMGDAEQLAWSVDRRKLRCAYQWCVVNGADPGANTGANTGAGPGGARHDLLDPRCLGGEGTPWVQPGAAEELAMSLRTTTTFTESLMADALDLRHRLPLVWGRVERLEVAPWRARRLAEMTRDVGLVAAREVDRRVVDLIGTCGVRRIHCIVQDVLARLDPEAHEAAEDRIEHQWQVRVDHYDGTLYEGTSSLSVLGDTLDLMKFEDLLHRVAHQLLDPEAPDGGAADLEIRKARAFGVIADRALAGVPVLDGETPVPPAAGVRLYLHLDAPPAGPGEAATGTVERLGAATVAKIRSWLQRADVTVVPVLDLGRSEAVDRHDPPAWMRELVQLRDGHCVFPWCDVDARRCDVDHIEPYVEGGPPGQTSPERLAPLCRRHHRVKTFAGWRYTRRPDGSYLWRTPQGRVIVVRPGPARTERW